MLNDHLYMYCFVFVHICYSLCSFLKTYAVGTSDEILFEEATKSELLYKDFNSEEKAYDTYNEYAFKHGFSIRIDKRKTRNDNSLKMKRFVCCNEGWKDDKARNKRVL